TINNPAPTLASIAPASANLSDTLDVVFNGTNYIAGVSTVNFGANITVNTITVNSSIKITANITIGAGAAVGPRNVSVTNSAPAGGAATLTNGFTVNNPATTTTVDSSLNPSTYGDSVTFTATVSLVSGSGTPTGKIIFYDGDCSTGTALTLPITLDGSGKASFMTSSLGAGLHTITACYSPTGIFQGSNGIVLQTVKKAAPTVTVTDPAPTYDGYPHSATATAVGIDGQTAVSGTFSFTYDGSGTDPINAKTSYAVLEIGRASCRERV